MQQCELDLNMAIPSDFSIKYDNIQMFPFYHQGYITLCCIGT